MKIAVVFTLDVPDGTDPQRVLEVVNQELDSAADGGGLVQWGSWDYTPALQAWVSGPGGWPPGACEICGASGNGGHGGGCPNGSDVALPHPVVISVETDEEEAAVIAAHRENRIKLGGGDYVIQRRGRTIAGRTAATTVMFTDGTSGAHLSVGGAGGSGGTYVHTGGGGE